MIMLKSCPRCRGDVLQSADGEFSCIQCGHSLRTDEQQRIARQLRDRRETALAGVR